jgi:hypothetical protein
MGQSSNLNVWLAEYHVVYFTGLFYERRVRVHVVDMNVVCLSSPRPRKELPLEIDIHLTTDRGVSIVRNRSELRGRIPPFRPPLTPPLHPFVYSLIQ